MRFLRYLLFLAPLAALGWGAWWYAGTMAPREARLEHRRVLNVYRGTARRLIANPDLGTPRDRPKGWRQQEKLDDVSWGYVREDGAPEVTVWISEVVRGRRLRTLRVPVEEERPVDRLVYVYAGLTFLAVCAVWLYLGWTFHRERRLREDFLAAAAHDLRTPLIGLQGALDYDLDYARVLTDRMLRMIGNINGFLQLGGRRPDPKCKDFALAPLVREAYRLFAPEFRDARGTEGGVPIEVPETLRVHADPDLVLQILWNLLGNDLKYAAPFGSVSIKAASAKGAAALAPPVHQLAPPVLQLLDTGPGMSAYARRRCFDRYYRAKTIRRSGKGGFGIGLCTARDLARAMGGELSVSANRPHGCIFTLELPAERGGDHVGEAVVGVEAAG